MKKFEEKAFVIPQLKGISTKNIEEHLKLYSGYVKNANVILEKIEDYKQDQEKHTYAISELQRRFAFEFDGMKNHEYYFESLVGGANPITEGPLKQAITEEWGSFEIFLSSFKGLALTRGVGWAWLVQDLQSKRLITHWVDEQHLGHLMGTQPILGIDMWEHAYVADYMPSGKKQYIEDFFENLNWEVIEKNFIE